MSSFEAAIAADDAKSVSAARESSGTCVDAADWLNVEDEPDNPLVEGFIECGEVVAMVGQAKAGKSLLALQLAVCVAAGVPFLNRTCKQQRVYLANLEVSEKQYKKRLRRVCGLLNLNPEQLRGWLFIDNMKGETASWNDALALCKSHNCTVAVIDPFYQIARIVETDEQQCLDAVEEMKAFARCGVTLCIVFHSPKGFSGDRQLIDMISGSSILARFPESVIGLLNHATEKTARVVDAVLRNYPPPEPFAVSLAEGALELAPDILPEVATARNSWKRAAQQERLPAIDMLQYVLSELDDQRNAAIRGNVSFRGMCLKSLGENVRQRIATEGKTPPGRDTTTNMIKGLPPDKIIITRKTAEGILVGTLEDMKWYTQK
jgi:archaellum biogenesis ATPase FlaH